MAIGSNTWTLLDTIDPGFAITSGGRIQVVQASSTVIHIVTDSPSPTNDRIHRYDVGAQTFISSLLPNGVTAAALSAIGDTVYAVSEPTIDNTIRFYRVETNLVFTQIDAATPTGLETTPIMSNGDSNVFIAFSAGLFNDPLFWKADSGGNLSFNGAVSQSVTLASLSGGFVEDGGSLAIFVSGTYLAAGSRGLGTNRQSGSSTQITTPLFSGTGTTASLEGIGYEDFNTLQFSANTTPPVIATVDIAYTGANQITEVNISEAIVGPTDPLGSGRIFRDRTSADDTDFYLAVPTGATGLEIWRYQVTPDTGGLDCTGLRSPVPLDQGTRLDADGALTFFMVQTTKVVPDPINVEGFTHITGIVQRPDEFGFPFVPVQYQDIPATNDGIATVRMLPDILRTDQLDPALSVVVRMTSETAVSTPDGSEWVYKGYTLPQTGFAGSSGRRWRLVWCRKFQSGPTLIERAVVASFDPSNDIIALYWVDLLEVTSVLSLNFMGNLVTDAATFDGGVAQYDTSTTTQDVAFDYISNTNGRTIIDVRIFNGGMSFSIQNSFTTGGGVLGNPIAGFQGNNSADFLFGGTGINPNENIVFADTGNILATVNVNVGSRPDLQSGHSIPSQNSVIGLINNGTTLLRSDGVTSAKEDITNLSDEEFFTGVDSTQGLAMAIDRLGVIWTASFSGSTDFDSTSFIERSLSITASPDATTFPVADLLTPSRVKSFSSNSENVLALVQSATDQNDFGVWEYSDPNILTTEA